MFLVQSKWKNDGTGGIHEEGMLKMVNGIKKILNLDFSDANQKIKKGSKTTYGMWCDKHGIKWANKTIPAEWIEDIHNDLAK